MANNGERENIPSIRPDADQVGSYRRTGRNGAPSQSNFNGLLVFGIVLLTIMMGIGGYALYEVQAKLSHANELLLQGQQNIDALESRLAATGTDVSKTLVDIEGRVTTNFGEIDKLWALAHRQNTPDIQKNVRAIEKLEVDLGGQLATLTAQISAMETKLQQGYEDEAEELRTQVALLRNQLQDMAVTHEGNRRNLSILSNRVKEIQQDIDAINGFRRQTNQRLNELQSQLAEPSGRANSPPGEANPTSLIRLSPTGVNSSASDDASSSTTNPSSAGTPGNAGEGESAEPPSGGPGR